MKFPKIKHALLSRIMVYVAVLGAFILPAVIVCLIDPIPEPIKAIFTIAMVIGLVVYIIKNFPFLMITDTMLAMLHCHNTARTQFPIPKHRSLDAIERRFATYGMKCEPMPIIPRPTHLRYKLSSSMTVYASAIERVVAVYHTDYLDAEEYRAIFNSITTNSKGLIGKKKPLLMDKQQRSAPLNRVTVAVIFARSVDDTLMPRLYETLNKQDGDGVSTSILPCIIDTGKGVCVFNSVRLPYVGFGYPVKNRGIALIRKFVFGGRLPLRGNPHTVKSNLDLDPEMSLWEYLRKTKADMLRESKRDEERFKNMEHGELIYDDGILYVKWQDRGACVAVELNEEGMVAEVDPIFHWFYPKTSEVAKDTRAEIIALITADLTERGYTITIIADDE